MNDPEIRQLLFTHLAKRKTDYTTDVYEEVPLKTGLIRADIVLMGNHLECFEIKGPNDSLKRLLDQGFQYQETFDRINIVCASKHLNKVLYLVPDWWGILEANNFGQLKTIQKAKNNPRRNKQGLVDLLNVNEAKNILRKTSDRKGISKLNHASLKELLSESIPEKELRQQIREALSKRTWNWCPSVKANKPTYPDLRTCAI